METVIPCSSSLSDCNGDIEQLLEVFGSAFSLEAITSAYSQSRRNVELAGVLLYESQRQTSLTCGFRDENDAASLSSDELSSEDVSMRPSHADGNHTSPVPRNIVSGFTGGDYARASLSRNGSLRLQLSEVDSSESLTASSNTDKDSSNVHENIEEFLFNMLGDGFQLDMKVIHNVLGLCGYDLEKSMETLVDMSAKSLEKSDDVVGIYAESSQEYLKNGLYPFPEKSEFPDSSLRILNQNGKKMRKNNKEKCDLERQILGALFAGPERVEEQPKQTNHRSGIRRSSAFGKPVTEPLRETSIEQTFVTAKPLGAVKEDEEDEGSFTVLRQAVKEYWGIMKEYYKAAVEAYTKGDPVRAHKLMKEGQFYNSKAREADEKSAQTLLETREEEMLLNLSNLEPKQAISLMRLQLSNLAGIPTIPFLKVTIGDDDGQCKRKRLILKLLEKDSIKCTKEHDGRTLVIRLDEINPKALSFAKN